MSPGRRIFDCVIQHIEEQATQLMILAEDLASWIVLKSKVYSLFLGNELHVPNNIF